MLKFNHWSLHLYYWFVVGEGTLPLHHLISYFTPRKLKHITSFTTARQKNNELPNPIIPRPPPMKP
jgi:hypothetical protein